MITLANTAIEVNVEPENGAQIMSICRPNGANVLASYSWEAPLHASLSSTYGDAVNDWLSEYRGGWQEMFPNAGAACTVEGVPLPFHGEVSRARWQIVSRADDEVVLRTPARLPIVIERRMRLVPDAPVLLLDETVTCDSALAMPFLWGHHPAFNAVEGARIDFPEGITVTADAAYQMPHLDLKRGGVGTWPNVPGTDGSPVALDRIGAGPVERLAFLTGFGDAAWVAIRGVEPGLGVAMAWDTATFPAAWFWWEVGGPGHPWQGRSRIVAVEPNTTTPADGLAAAIERGVAHRVAPGQTYSTWLTVALFDADGRTVRSVARDGMVTQWQP